MKAVSTPSKLTLIIATIVSGLLWYYAIDISGDYGFLVWIAPLPILWTSLHISGKASFACAFLAYLIGRISWISFLSVLMPLVPIIIVTVLPPIVFGLYILLNRWIILKSQSTWALFAFPVIVTAFEFLIFNNQVDGTAGGLAYTQSNYLPLIQIASVTGIWGIVFIVSLFPTAIVLVWYFRESRGKRTFIIGIASAVLLGTVIFGFVRVNQKKPQTDVTVGITVVSENLYSDLSNPQRAKMQIINQYDQQISSLAKQGAQYILIPEKIFHIQKDKRDSLLLVFQKIAAQANSTLIGGIALRKDSTRQNLVYFIPPSGVVQEYQKRFHVKGFEGDFEPGNKIGLLRDTPFSAGMAICKDMDFPQWLRNYQDVDLLFVPAWDFVKDGWLHSRMAVMRGVENGTTIVRAGRQGRLTVSDYRGKIVAEASCENGLTQSLLAEAPVYHIDTIYSTCGDWFGWLSIFLTVVFVARALIISRRKNIPVQVSLIKNSVDKNK